LKLVVEGYRMMTFLLCCERRRQKEVVSSLRIESCNDVLS